MKSAKLSLVALVMALVGLAQEALAASAVDLSGVTLDTTSLVTFFVSTICVGLGVMWVIRKSTKLFSKT